MVSLTMSFIWPARAVTTALEVLTDLAELGGQIALADHAACLVQRDLAGDVDGLAALDLPAVGVSGRLGQTRWIDGLHELGHGSPLYP